MDVDTDAITCKDRTATTASDRRAGDEVGALLSAPIAQRHHAGLETPGLGECEPRRPPVRE